MKYVFFVNPTAGKGNLQDKIIKSIDEFFAHNDDDDYDIYITKFKGDAESQAKRLAGTGENIRMFACGGEGTAFEVLNGIVGFENVSLGVIPCGSANDFLKFFDSKDKFLNLKSQIEGTPVKMDIIKAGDRYCLNGCSVGMDAVIARDMSDYKNLPLVSGPMAYKLAIVKNFVKKIGIVANIFVDGEDLGKMDCLFAVIANAPYYGGGYMSAPDAVPNDGKLNFTLVKNISKIKIPKFLSLYEKGLHNTLDYCTLKECRSMEFKSDKPIPVNLDGEIIESKNMKFEIVKDAVSYIVPVGVEDKLLIKV